MLATTVILGFLQVFHYTSAAVINGDTANTLRTRNDPQFSTTLDPSQIQHSLNFNGIFDNGDPNIAPALTSPNNFINFCLTQPVPLTDGKQVEDGSCNPTPLGRIVAKSKMPSAKFQFPKNGDIIQAFTPFQIQVAVRNFQTGTFTNPATNYFGSPQTVNDQGFLIGHSHVVIERTDFQAIDPLDPLQFSFFKGLNADAIDGVLSTEVTDGLEPGVYRLSTINTSATHQPALVAVAQHGSLDDAVYFEVVSQQEFEQGDGECFFTGEPN